MSRRKALKAIGATVIAPGVLKAEERQMKRSRWDLIFGGQPTAPAPVRPVPAEWDPTTITAAWIGHATVLINFFGTTILTDPVFSSRSGINVLRLFTLGPKRLVAPALTIDELPPIDLMLLSHAHMDHIDLPSLRKFKTTIPTVMAKNTSDIIRTLDWENVRELDWEERATVAGVEIEALKVRHFGWRFPWEDDRSKGNMSGRSFNGYLLTKNGKSILFAGDTAYQNFFTALGARPNLDIELAIMPIGAYDPWIAVHATPEQAVTMANHARAKAILPVHWGTFILSDEPVQEPIERLKRAIALHSPSLALEHVGETWRMGAAAERTFP